MSPTTMGKLTHGPLSPFPILRRSSSEAEARSEMPMPLSLCHNIMNYPLTSAHCDIVVQVPLRHPLGCCCSALRATQFNRIMMHDTAVKTFLGRRHTLRAAPHRTYTLFIYADHLAACARHRLFYSGALENRWLHSTPLSNDPKQRRGCDNDRGGGGGTTTVMLPKATTYVMSCGPGFAKRDHPFVAEKTKSGAFSNSNGWTRHLPPISHLSPSLHFFFFSFPVLVSKKQRPALPVTA